MNAELTSQSFAMSTALKRAVNDLIIAGNEIRYAYNMASNNGDYVALHTAMQLINDAKRNAISVISNINREGSL